MFENVFSIPIALFFLSFLIFIHELAHFLAGKAVGIHAEVFSIGFGPALIKFTHGTTEYRLAVIPAGGYVKFPGEYSEDEDGRLEGDFHQSAIWRRAVVVAAGPLSNLVLGVLVFAFLAMYGLPDKSMPPVGDVIDTEEQQTTYWENPSYRSPAAEAGILPGDLITAVDGRDVPTWEDFTHEVMIRPDKPTVLRVERDGVSRDVPVTPRPVLRGKMTIGRVGIAASQPLVVVDDDGAHPITSFDGRPAYGYSLFHDIAEEGGARDVLLGLDSGVERSVRVRTRVLAAVSPSPDIEMGDALVAIDGVAVRTLEDARRMILASPTEEAVFKFEGEDGSTAEVAAATEMTVVVAGVDGKRFPAVKKLRLGDSLKAVNGTSIQAYDEVRDVLRDASPVEASIRLTFEHRSRLLFAKWTRAVDVETPVRWHDGHLVAPGLTLRSNFSDGNGYLTVGAVTIAEQLEMLDAETGAALTIGMAEPSLERYGPVGALGKGTEMTVAAVDQMMSLLKRLIVGEVSVRYISGPVGIVNITQKTLARGGWSWDTFLSIFYLMALISVNLAIVNLLPIPIADGGQLAFFAFEGVRGRPMDLKWQVAIQQVSVVLLIGLFALVTLKDLVYW
ncbi:PDZ domain-containing protein [Candidatus Poribacteria bacterium]|jgi:regulator of sigma E protease|nr:PDZ domain-containing protein [Candidatus Poribacteria bacterium]MBT5536821.1 PDZ domain-containing protein [Candidatus Poribacteria bacterium]MBT5710929.1 PDZ domain-containing protein [Candidatus Poribacteria bacterium]MBT7808507.1 PDZ domain-containing protein [Candidatus Poribacteria bacterium]